MLRSLTLVLAAKANGSLDAGTTQIFGPERAARGLPREANVRFADAATPPIRFETGTAGALLRAASLTPNPAAPGTTLGLFALADGGDGCLAVSVACAGQPSAPSASANGPFSRPDCFAATDGGAAGADRPATGLVRRGDRVHRPSGIDAGRSGFATGFKTMLPRL